VRPPIYGVGIVLLGLAAAPVTGRTQTLLELQHADRVRLAEGWHLADQVCDQLWTGWGHTDFQVLLVGDSAEFLVGDQRSDRHTSDFTRLGYDAVLGAEVWTRPRRFSATLLATFPAVGGVPTIVIGSAERTGKSSTAWILALLHEHFHQWQYSQTGYYAAVSRLGLARGDTTGQWMLDYPFPYDSVPIQRAMRSLARALARALEARPEMRQGALQGVSEHRDILRNLLTADDYRYFEFQLWQEGVARFTEYAVARAAAASREPSADYRSLADYEPYSQAAEDALGSLRLELEQLDLGRQRRVAFYPIGAALALLLDESRADWKRAYTRQRFTLPDLLVSRLGHQTPIRPPITGPRELGAD
jgi:hypothetical protein